VSPGSETDSWAALKLERLRELQRLQAEASRRRATRAQRSAVRYLYDPVAWAHDIIDWPRDAYLTTYQSEILAELPVRRRAAVRGPHGLGKTGIASLVVLWFATTRDACGIDWKVLTTASAWRHLSVYLWPEIHKWARRIRWSALGREPFNPRTEMLDLHLKLGFGAASAVASNRPELIEGAHADSLLYLLDEAKVIPNGTWDAIEGAFSGGRTSGLPEAFALAVSTPGPPAGRFYDIHKRSPGLDDWWVRHVTLDEAIAAGRIAPEWATQRALQWGAESAIYHNRVLGEFHAADEDTVIPLAWAEAAVERWHAWDAAGRPPVTGRRVLGVDVARGGTDRTVLAHRTGVLVERLDAHHGEDTMRTTSRVLAALEGVGEVTPVVDSIGVGGGVVDRLRELGVQVLPYTGSAKTDARDRTGEHGFVNVRSAAYWHLRELLDPAFGAELMLPPDELLLADLNTPTWEVKTGVPPKIRVEPKEKLVARLGRSPDHGDSVVMSLWADALRREVDMVTPTGVMPSSVQSPLSPWRGGGVTGAMGPLAGRGFTPGG
jgi:hypothetical protein